MKLASNANTGSYSAKETLTITGADRVYYKVGETIELKARDGEQEAEVVWYSGNESLASVDENGRVTLKGAGTILIYAKGEGQRLGCLLYTSRCV